MREALQTIFPAYRFGLEDADAAATLAEMGVGGFCLFGGRPDEIEGFTARLQKLAPKPLLFCADYEDGLPTMAAGGTPLPSNMGLGAAGSEELAFEKGAVTAAEARAVGVSWVLGPVCDLATAPDNPIVNVRSFSADPKEVTRLARAYLRGLRSQGALGCVKHFPGHGETVEDSHLKLPTISVPLETLKSRELAPFAALAAEAPAVMTGHLAVTALSGPDLPYSLSDDVAKTLRGALGFRGLVSTDAFSMQAVAGSFDELDAARRALLGGSDVILVPADAMGLARALPGAAEEDAALGAAARAAAARIDAAVALAAGGPAAALSEVGGPAHAARAQALADACLAWSGKPGAPLPKAVAYWEPEAAGPDEWQGAEFVEALRAEGREVSAWKEGTKADALLVGSFLTPRAYAGRIRYDEEEAARVKKALSSAADGRLVSFGSPFVFAALGASGLCAFAFSAPAQRAAARALAGSLPVKGRMPV